MSGCCVQVITRRAKKGGRSDRPPLFSGQLRDQAGAPPSSRLSGLNQMKLMNQA